MFQNIPEISIIIPVYNAEKYLHTCIQSVLRQTYKDFELILVDDGSLDSSAAICEYYQQMDRRVIVCRKANGGAAEARNFGIDKARGNYLCFVDADDFVGQEYLEILYHSAEEFHADIAAVKAESVPEQCEKADKHISKKNENFICFNKQMALEEVLLGRGVLGVAPWGRIYKKALWEDIRFPNGVRYEDVVTIPYVFAKCEKTVWCDAIEYYYRRTPDSLTHAKITEKDMDLFRNMDTILDYIDEKFPQLHDAAIDRMIKENICILYRLVDCEDYERVARKIRDKYRKLWAEALKCRYVPWNRKIQLVLMLSNLKMYKYCRKIANKVKGICE